MSIAAQTTATIEVTFPKAFSKPPYVDLQIYSGGSSYRFGMMSFGVVRGSVTTTGFKVYAYNASASSDLMTPSLTWRAEPMEEDLYTE